MSLVTWHESKRILLLLRLYLFIAKSTVDEPAHLYLVYRIVQRMNLFKRIWYRVLGPNLIPLLRTLYIINTICCWNTYIRKIYLLHCMSFRVFCVLTWNQRKSKPHELSILYLVSSVAESIPVSAGKQRRQAWDVLRMYREMNKLYEHHV